MKSHYFQRPVIKHHYDSVYSFHVRIIDVIAMEIRDSVDLRKHMKFIYNIYCFMSQIHSIEPKKKKNDGIALSSYIYFFGNKRSEITFEHV